MLLYVSFIIDDFAIKATNLPARAEKPAAFCGASHASLATPRLGCHLSGAGDDRNSSLVRTWSAVHERVLLATTVIASKPAIERVSRRWVEFGMAFAKKLSDNARRGEEKCPRKPC
jgi:hypothetical protein